MKCKALFEQINALNSKYISIWEECCNIESPTKYKAGVDAVGNYFAALAHAQGWKVERFEHDKAGDVICITMNPDADAAPICFSGHMDTVHPVGSFGTPAVRIEGDKIYGPGVEDCKGGIVAGFLAMEALKNEGFTERPVMMLLQSDEEVGSAISDKATIGYMCERAKDAAAFLNLEGYKLGTACLVRKGTINFTFKVKGVEAHSSLCATKGSNAIVEAAYKIIELDKLKDAEGITCSCGVITGGTVPNTVAGECEFKVNVRYANKEQLAWARNFVQEVADKIHIEGCTCTVDQPRGRVAMEFSQKNVDLFNKMNDIFEQNGLVRLEMSKSNGGSDAADTSEYGIPTIDSLGVLGGNIHSPDEYAYLDSLAEAARRLAAVVYCF